MYSCIIYICTFLSVPEFHVGCISLSDFFAAPDFFIQKNAVLVSIQSLLSSRRVFQKCVYVAFVYFSSVHL